MDFKRVTMNQERMLMMTSTKTFLTNDDTNKTDHNHCSQALIKLHKKTQLNKEGTLHHNDSSGIQNIHRQHTQNIIQNYSGKLESPYKRPYRKNSPPNKEKKIMQFEKNYMN